MIRHLAFFEALGSLGENSDAARRVTAGLVVLRLVDDVCLHELLGPRNVSIALRPVAEAVAVLRDPDRAGRDLSAILQLIGRSTGPIDRAAMGELLLAYGRTLDLEANWELAADVFQTAAEIAPATAPAIGIDADTMLGAAARRAGEWDASSDAYARAVHTASVAGDLRRALKAEVGLANNDFARGNLPAADEMLDSVMADARTNGFSDVTALALHTRASVAHHRGHYADAVELAYDALTLTTDESARDVILTDIGSAFAELGMRDAARDAHLIASVTSRSPMVRGLATLNLMELASLDGMEEAFDTYAAAVAHMPLEARFRAYYLLYFAQGEQRLGRVQAAARSLQQAKQFAAGNGMHQVLFEAEAALATLAGASSAPVAIRAEPAPKIPDSARRIAGELTQMRELALAGR